MGGCLLELLCSLLSCTWQCFPCVDSSLSLSSLTAHLWLPRGDEHRDEHRVTRREEPSHLHCWVASGMPYRSGWRCYSYPRGCLHQRQAELNHNSPSPGGLQKSREQVCQKSKLLRSFQRVGHTVAELNQKLFSLGSAVKCLNAELGAQLRDSNGEISGGACKV